MRELNSEELENVSGAAWGAAVLGGAMFALSYIGGLGTAQSFGRGIGIGLYDALHKAD